MSVDQDRKKAISAVFNKASAGYDGPELRFFFESANHLAELLVLRGDERVLDVATGTGHAALEIAKRLPEVSTI